MLGLTESERKELSVLAREVAKAVWKVTRETPLTAWGETVGMGADGTPTKRIDKLAEDAALAALEASASDLNVVSEECGEIDRGGDLTLVMDPIDGTTNAVQGIPYYCLPLAIGRRDTDGLVYGFVQNLATGDVYEAFRGAGATFNEAPIRTRPYPEREKPTFVVVLGKNARSRALELATRRANVRALGAAALDLCLVARGAADLYYHGNGDLRVTDLAASTLIVREAGGEVLDETGERLVIALSLKPRAIVVALGDPSARDRVEAFA